MTKDYLYFPIVNFPFLCSNIPSAPVYGVFISQLMQYSRAYGSYHDLLVLKTYHIYNMSYQFKMNIFFIQAIVDVLI